MQTLLRGILVLAMAMYPVLVYFGLQHWNLRTLALVVLALVIARALFWRRAATGDAGRGNTGAGWFVMLAAVLVVVAALVSNQTEYFLYYPVVMNMALLGVFVSSLLHPPTVIERLARLQEPDLPASGVRYTRRVTQVWSLFFLVNGGIAFYTARFCSLEVWTLYNGLIAYLLMGVLFAGEFLFRNLFVRR